jgi:two-component system, sensor histidine kinase PdtaS
LICNEIITNFFKHVYSLGTGKLTIAFQKAGNEYILEANDNGPGFNLSDSGNSFGIKLIHSLVKQLGGTSKVKCINGTHWQIRFRSTTP